MMSRILLIAAIVWATAACETSSSVVPDATLDVPSVPDAASPRDAARDAAGVPRDIPVADIQPGGACEGNQRIARPVDVERLAPCTSIGGSLEVAAGRDVTKLVLPHLRSIGGQLRLEQDAHLRTLRLPALETVADVWIVGNGGLVELDLRRLETVTGNVLLEEDASLRDLDLRSLTRAAAETVLHLSEGTTALELPALVEAEFLAVSGLALTRLDLSSLQPVGSLQVDDTALTRIDLPALVSVGTLHVGGSPSLTHLALPSGITEIPGYLVLFVNLSLVELDIAAIESVGIALEFVGCDALTTIDLPALTSVGKHLRIDGNATLTSVRLSALTSTNANAAPYDGDNSFGVIDNPRLEPLEIPALVSVGDCLYLRGNPSLCESVVQALLDQLGAAGWTGYTEVSDNKPGC